jgi:hypothetical protein
MEINCGDSAGTLSSLIKKVVCLYNINLLLYNQNDVGVILDIPDQDFQDSNDFHDFAEKLNLFFLTFFDLK